MIVSIDPHLLTPPPVSPLNSPVDTAAPGRMGSRRCSLDCDGNMEVDNEKFLMRSTPEQTPPPKQTVRSRTVERQVLKNRDAGIIKKTGRMKKLQGTVTLAGLQDALKTGLLEQTVIQKRQMMMDQRTEDVLCSNELMDALKDL